MAYRKEVDSLGSVDVPSNAYYGIFSTRAKENFQISGQKVNLDFVKELAKVKIASAYANEKSGILSKKIANAIIKASEELIQGKLDNHIIVENIQAGGSTPTNMNVNEVIANRANEIIGSSMGTGSTISPYNHVNMSQSSNDVIPTAANMLILKKVKYLQESIQNLQDSFLVHSKAHTKTVKVARTHMEDAVPISMGQVFNSYSEILYLNLERLEATKKEFEIVPMGGTAVGTEINTPKGYAKHTITKLKQLTKLKLKKSKNCSTEIQSMGRAVYLSGILSAIASDLIRICENLILMNSGPTTGLEEISLPEVEQGSSIMAGKANPSMCESTIMACFEVIGNHNMITTANHMSHLELNIYNPMIIDKVVTSLDNLANSMDLLNHKAIKGLIVNKDRCQEYIEGSVCFATVLNPYIGYENTEKIVNLALKEKKTIRNKLIELDFLDKTEINSILKVENLLSPHNINTKLKKKILTNPRFIAFSH